MVCLREFCRGKKLYEGRTGDGRKQSRLRKQERQVGSKKVERKKSWKEIMNGLKT